MQRGASSSRSDFKAGRISISLAAIAALPAIS